MDFSGNEFNRNTLGGGVDNERIVPGNVLDKQIETDVKDCCSDAVYKRGIDEFPVFDVSKEEFFGNMEAQRTRQRFTGKASQFNQGSRFKRPFYVRHTDEDGKTYVRRVK